jgi:5-methylcytosine-specific restriction endonuclease McrA
MANGVVHPAKVVDHIKPHKGDKARFWDSCNWQALCGWCHNAVKQPLEARWLKGLLPATLLPLNRVVDGFVHPADR